MSGSIGRDGVPGGVPRIGVFVSGGGRTLRNLHGRIGSGRLDAEIGVVVASRECGGAAWARSAGLETRVVSHEMSSVELESVVSEWGIDWVVLAGYLRLVPVPASLRGRIVNVHPALLPSFGGAGMYGLRVHRAVLEAGCKVSGCTVHLCDDRYDTGPIVAQAACEVRETDTAETLAARVFELELELYPSALADLLAGRVRIEGCRAVRCGGG